MTKPKKGLTLDPLQTLKRALDEVAFAKQCVSDNKGYDKETAREAFQHCVAETLQPAVYGAVDWLIASGDGTDKEWIHLGELVSRMGGRG